MPDDVLGRINAALEDWENGDDAARWQPDGGPDELAGPEWTAYCAPGHLTTATLMLALTGQPAARVQESAILQGPDVVLVNNAATGEALSLDPLPLEFAPPPRRFDPLQRLCEDIAWRGYLSRRPYLPVTGI
jgi:hypothetical protein